MRDPWIGCGSFHTGRGLTLFLPAANAPKLARPFSLRAHRKGAADFPLRGSSLQIESGSRPGCSLDT
jgi:hypothetical protein